MSTVCSFITQKGKNIRDRKKRMVSSRLKEIVFCLFPIERRRSVEQLQEFGHDDAVMMSSADRLLCLLWSFPLCLGAPVGL